VFPHLHIEPVGSDAPGFPQAWRGIASLSGREAVREALVLWREVVPDGFLRLIGLLDAHCADVVVVRVSGKEAEFSSLALMYAIAGSGHPESDWQFRFGLAPVDDSAARGRVGVNWARQVVFIPALERFGAWQAVNVVVRPVIWERIPRGLRRIYTDLHNGFLETLHGDDRGLVAIESLCTIDNFYKHDDFAGDFWVSAMGADGQLILPRDQWPDLVDLLRIATVQWRGWLCVDIGDADSGRVWELWHRDGLERGSGDLFTRLDDLLVGSFHALPGGWERM
jgi:hypothetical protein